MFRWELGGKQSLAHRIIASLAESGKKPGKSKTSKAGSEMARAYSQGPAGAHQPNHIHTAPTINQICTGDSKNPYEKIQN